MSPSKSMPRRPQPTQYHHETLGVLRGLLRNEILQFRGIPYASIPARFRQSVVLEKLPQQPFEATEPGYFRAMLWFRSLQSEKSSDHSIGQYVPSPFSRPRTTGRRISLRTSPAFPLIAPTSLNVLTFRSQRHVRRRPLQQRSYLFSSLSTAAPSSVAVRPYVSAAAESTTATKPSVPALHSVYPSLWSLLTIASVPSASSLLSS